MGTPGGTLLTLSEGTEDKVYPRENALEGGRQCWALSMSAVGLRTPGSM